MDDRELHKLVARYCDLVPWRVYAELALTGILSWTAYVYLVVAPLDGRWLLCFGLGNILLYRGLSFSHEVVHLHRRLRWFRALYNAMFGFPHRVPAYTLLPHRHHHSTKSYGTLDDPEYERWPDFSPWVLGRPLVSALFVPVFITLRLGVWPWVLLVLPRRVSEGTYRYASTLVMNVRYRRPDMRDEQAEMRREDLLAASYFVAFCMVSASLSLFWKAFAVWYLQAWCVTAVNTYRALIAHRYMAHRAPSATRRAQVADAVTVEGSWLTSLWAPIGLRYHSTHHYFPRVPYYNLAKAHALIKASVPPEHEYLRTIEPSFLAAARKFVAACKTAPVRAAAASETEREK